MKRRHVLNSLAGAVALSAIPKAFATAALPSLDLLVVGDWGRNGTSHQRDVADQMAIAARTAGSEFVISVGDNFYEDGVSSVSDPLWQSSFEEIYAAPSLQIPWYVALGNHDYRGVPQAQIDYSRASSRWRMPARYFKVSGESLRAPHVDLFFLDTSPLVHAYRENVHGVIAANVASQSVSDQLQWLDEALGRSVAAWKLVIGHHTIYSGGSAHGDTPELKALVDPILRRHGVQAYLNGHDHDLQHIRRDGMDYLCCGAGSEVRPVNRIPGTLFCVARSGFAVIRSTPTALAFEYRDFAGVTLYRSSVPQGAAAKVVQRNL